MWSDSKYNHVCKNEFILNKTYRIYILILPHNLIVCIAK